MFNFLRPFFEIAFFQRSPETLPSDERYVYLTMLALTLVSVGIVHMLGRLSVSYLLVLLASFVIMAFILQQLLGYVKKTERFKQTFSAVLGTDMAINIMMLPAAYASITFPVESLSFQLGGTAILLSFVWSIGVLGHILHLATDLKRLDCNIIALCIKLFMLMLSSLI